MTLTEKETINVALYVGFVFGVLGNLLASSLIAIIGTIFKDMLPFYIGIFIAGILITIHLMKNIRPVLIKLQIS